MADFGCRDLLRIAQAVVLYSVLGGFGVLPPITLLGSATAQQPPAEATAPPDLPTRNADGVGGQTISATNLAQYRSLLVPELVPIVRSGKLEFDAIKQLSYDWRYEESWYAGMADRSGKLTEGKLAGLPKGNRGLLAVSPFLNPVAEVSDALKRQAGSSALWASMSAAWSIGAIRSEFELLIFGKDVLERGTFANIIRIYPSFLGSADETGQVFRELISFSAPEPINALRWLSFRFLGDEEDIVWVFSPAIRQARQLTGSNRSDRLFARSIPADDLLGWSGKPELVEAEYDRELIGLIPFPSHLPAEAVVQPNGCFGIAALLSGGEPRFNADAHRYSQSAPWLPSSWVWTPRKLHRIVLTSNDPYALHGRQVLYLDDQSLMPVVRVVYSRTGRYLKTVITAFGLAVDAKYERKFWYPSVSLIEDDEAGQFVAVDYRRTTVCDTLLPEFLSPEFDPRKLGSHQVTKAAPEGEKVRPQPTVPSIEEAVNNDD